MNVRNAKTQQCLSMMDTWYNNNNRRSAHTKRVPSWTKYKCTKSVNNENSVTYLIFAFENPAK